MFKYVLIFLVLIISIFSSHSQSLEENIEQVFTDFQLMGMSVWVEKNGIEESFHFGLKDLDRNLEIDEQTKYRIASISKTVTALGLLKLYDQGLFDLDDPINDYLSFPITNPSFPGTEITFRTLLSHTSSIQDGSGYNGFLNATFSQNPIPSMEELLSPGGAFYTSNMYRTETPGTYFAYSNLNYGVIATLIEAISNEPFDVYMKNELLSPMGITGSFNIQDITDIDDIAVLYRNQGGWNPQFDNYQGVMPSPPSNLPSLVLGTNGLFFSPQGGLRASANELGAVLQFIKSDGATLPGFISEVTLEEMKSIQWDYNGSNGDNYFDLFNRWGLGVHHANLSEDDQICIDGEWGTFMGHPGEAYGLISDAYFSEEGEVAFSFLTNGSFLGYQFGNISSYYTVEEALFSVLCSYFNEPLAVDEIAFEQVTVFPNPVSEGLKIEGIKEFPVQVKLFDLRGVLLFSESIEDIEMTTLNFSEIKKGLYFLEIKAPFGESQKSFKVFKQ
ncbi:MAG: serine hydrolase [Flavobacteriaceae bacterium]